MRSFWVFLGQFSINRWWFWSCSPNTLATWCKELTHLKRPWWWERLKAGGEGDHRGWDGWMASLTQWPWVWVNSGSWWWTGRPGMLQFMGSQRIGHNWGTELNWTEWFIVTSAWMQVFPGLKAHLLDRKRATEHSFSSVSWGQKALTNYRSTRIVEAHHSPAGQDIVHTHSKHHQSSQPRQVSPCHCQGSAVINWSPDFIHRLPRWLSGKEPACQ